MNSNRNERVLFGDHHGMDFKGMGGKAMQVRKSGFVSGRVTGLLLILMLMAIPVQVAADGPVDLTTGMTGAFPWSVSGIVPGSSGSTFIQLHNNGTAGGTLYVWIDNITEIDPHGSGNALDNYMYFNVSHPRLVSTVLLPAHASAFPPAPLRADYIIVPSFAPGEMIQLAWTWEFREAGRPQNDAQEAVLHFNISYMLVNLPSPTPPTTPPTTRPTTAPTPTPTAYSGGGSGGGGGGHRTNTFTGPLSTPVLPAQTGQPGPSVCRDEVSRNYTAGLSGLVYNADGNQTLDLDIGKARAAGATVTVSTDHIDVYYRNASEYLVSPDPSSIDPDRNRPSGILLRFLSDTADIQNATRITRPVKNAELWTDPLRANLSTGPFSGSVHAIPAHILPASAINVTISRCIPEETLEKVRYLSAENNLTLENTVYLMNVTWTGVPDARVADVTLTLPPSWMEVVQEPALVHIAGISLPNGKTGLAHPVVSALEPDGSGRFQGVSPDGASRFVLFSAGGRAPQPPGPAEPRPDNPFSMVLLAAILLFVLAALILIILLLGWRRKKQS